MKKTVTILAALCLCLSLSVPCFAMDVNIDAPQGRELAKPTSIEPIVTADGGKQANADLSKNTVLVAPGFGTEESYLPGSGEYLTPNLMTNHLLTNTTVQNVSGGIITPQNVVLTPEGWSIVTGSQSALPTYRESYTAVTSSLYYGSGSSKYLGTLKIPSLDVNVKIYQGTDSKALAKGAGHFENTSIWDGNVCLAGHNRGTNCYFGNIHKLKMGDTMKLTTRLGTRTYAVTSVEKVKETDNTKLARESENCITLYTCVRNEKAYRWCVRAEEI